jgi:dTMP kinase
MSFFITLEGIEGSGKTTQLQRLQSHLCNAGHQVVVTREPGGCSIADAIRTLLLDPGNDSIVPQAELLLYSAARAQHVARLILPALEQGKIVVCDRFADATTVYQGAGRGLDMTQLEAVNRFASKGLTPDLTLLLDYPVEEGLHRARVRNQSASLASEGRFELESFAFHRRVRQAYLELAAREERFRVIDALGDEDVVAARVVTAVDLFLASRRSA